jgi:hypothetical protein
MVYSFIFFVNFEKKRKDKHVLFSMNVLIMRVSLNVSIRWEMKFYNKYIYLLGQGNIGAKLIFPKNLFRALL